MELLEGTIGAARAAAMARQETAEETRGIVLIELHRMNHETSAARARLDGLETDLQALSFYNTRLQPS